jgi:hypothetical protein
MIFQCGDLDRALEFPELLPDARAHAETCQRCREQLYLWSEISRVAPRLHEEWDSPELWNRIRADVATMPIRRKSAPVWRWALAAAAVVLIAAMLLKPWRRASDDFLTDDALQQVQQAEVAYAKSIANLSRIAGPALDRSPSPLATAYREKLLVLDSEIAEVKAEAERNRYNTFVQTELASLYREKQKTLQDWLENAKRNSPTTH